MGLLDSTQESTDRVLAVMASQPLDPIKPEPKHSAWSVLPRAVAAAAVEIGGNVIDTAGAFGQVAAATGGVTPGFDPSAESNRPASIKAAEKLKTDGIDWRTEEGQAQYDYARKLRPDPITAGKAEQIVFGLSKGLTKAVGASVGLGPFGGAAAFGVSEGLTTAEDLAHEGVDQATRTKVGAVAGVLNAAGMALPVAGNTIPKTLALAAAGGPASFIGQQMATRAILENADYGALAQQYDPLDPVGLSIATLLPAGFGAWAMRSARTARQPMVDTKTPNHSEVAPATQETFVPATQDHIDAAMVQNLTIRQDIAESRLGGIGRQIASGVLDTANGISESIITAARSLRDFVAGPASDARNNSAKINFAEVDAESAARIAAQTGVEVGAGARHEAGANMVRHALSSHPEMQENDWAMLPWLANRFERAVLLKTQPQDQGPRIALAAIDDATGYAYVAEYRVGRKRGERMSLVTFFRDKPGAVENYLRTNGRDAKGGTPDASMPPVGSERLTSATSSGGYAIEAPTFPKVKDPHIASVLARAEALRVEQPDMPVAVREDGSHATFGEEIEAIRKQALQGTDTEFGAQDAPLLKIAAECFLSIGS